jgi:hypothetical protein
MRDDPGVQAMLWKKATSLKSFFIEAAMLICLDIVPQIADFVFEVIALNIYYKNGDTWWFGLTIACIFLPGFVIGIGCIFQSLKVENWKKAFWNMYIYALGVLIFFPIIPVIR